MAAAESLWLPLGELLVERGLLGQRQLELALLEQRRNGRPLGEVLVGLRFVSNEVLTATLLDQVGLAAGRAEREPEPEPEAELVPALARRPEPAPDVAPEPRGPVIIRMDAGGERSPPAPRRVEELEALVDEFTRRSDEIDAEIAEIRGAIKRLKRD